ncbi:MAG: ethanolamine ammonia-lyase subunit EutC [Oscillospiraceae bacterium]|nr:ethanolamine ammonia-lyase subunit EutC [Oscillospiraceae bacterium]
MDKTELRSLVEELLRDLQPSAKPSAPNKEVRENFHDGILPDITAEDLREQYLVADPHNKDAFMALKRKTPARVGVGRAGARYRTTTMLRFRADHAAAQDSVFSLVGENFYKDNHFPFVKTMCKDKDEYLTRPDLGRRFSPESQSIIRNLYPTPPKILLVIGDGLSSAAVEANAVDCMKAIRQGLGSIPLGETLFVQFCRVGASDHLGEITGAEIVCMLVGERPGLVTAESMSCYITYKPYPGIPESKRTVISNIHRQGTPAVEAGAHIATLLLTMLEKKASGIDLGRMQE